MVRISAMKERFDKPQAYHWNEEAVITRIAKIKCTRSNIYSFLTILGGIYLTILDWLKCERLEKN